MKHVQAMWLQYSRVLSPDAGTVQIVETRRAFFAGAFALFGHIITRLSPESDEASAADLRYLAELDIELRAFAREQGGGS